MDGMTVFGCISSVGRYCCRRHINGNAPVGLEVTLKKKRRERCGGEIQILTERKRREISKKCGKLNYE